MNTISEEDKIERHDRMTSENDSVHSAERQMSARSNNEEDSRDPAKGESSSGSGSSSSSANTAAPSAILAVGDQQAEYAANVISRPKI